MCFVTFILLVEWNGKNLFWSIKNSGHINKLKSKCFLASSLSAYDFSTLYTTLPHNLVKEKLNESNEQTFSRAHFIWLVIRNVIFITSKLPKRYVVMSESL